MAVAGVVITRNEEANITRCLQSLSFCDEIIVVDAESTDRTIEIARQHTAKVHVRPWNGYADQKNYAASLATSSWVLSLDADEEVTPELREEICRRLKSVGEVVAFTIPRKTIHSGRWIRYGGWYPNRLVRLFRRDKGQWVGSEVHERWEASGNVEPLEGHLNHYSFRDISDQVLRNDHYSTLGAQQLHRDGKRFSAVKLLGKPCSKFLETYLIKRGFLDGYPGFIISISAAYSVFLKWAKLWELQRGATSQIKNE